MSNTVVAVTEQHLAADRRSRDSGRDRKLLHGDASTVRAEIEGNALVAERRELLTPSDPLFSTRLTVPALSMSAIAVPSLPPRDARMAPLFLMVVTVAPASIAIACALVVAVPPPATATEPVTSMTGTVAPAPIRMPVAFASVANALTVPEMVIPPAMFTACPRPPITIALPATPL
jgi:hypothetical protein